MLFYRSSLPLSRSTLNYVTGLLRRNRTRLRSKGRALTPGQQALMTLAHLKKDETFAQLAAGFGVGTTTAWRYVNETVCCCRPARASTGGTASNCRSSRVPKGRSYGCQGRLPGSIHDLRAAQNRGIVRALAACGLPALADRGYHGTGPATLTPYKGKNKPASQKQANRSHAKLRGPGERANAQLKQWKVLAKLRCCPFRAGHLAKDISVLQNREASA